MDKTTLGLLLVPVAIANIYWSARIYTLMSFRGDPKEVATRQKKAALFSKYSKVSYFAVVGIVGIFWLFKGR
jgi:hypothetical protein